MGRPGLPPGVYFRMLMVGYLEGIGSERGIAWRCRDSISLREFLGYGLAKRLPEHSTLSKTRKRLSLEAHGAVFGWVLERLQESGLLRGKTVGVDSTTLEANAAMRAIVRRDEGTEYDAWLGQLAKASGIETPTRQDLAKMDRKRPKKGSNKEIRKRMLVHAAAFNLSLVMRTCFGFGTPRGLQGLAAAAARLSPTRPHAVLPPFFAISGPFSASWAHRSAPSAAQAA